MTSRTKIGVLLALTAVLGLFGLMGLKATTVGAFPIAFGAGNATTLTPGVTSGPQTATYNDAGLGLPAVLTVSTTGGTVAIMSCSVSPLSTRVVTFVVGSATCSITSASDTIPVTLTYTLLCSGVGTITVTLTQGTAITQTVQCTTVAAVAPFCTPLAEGTGLFPLSTVTVCKIDQRAVPVSATFHLTGAPTAGGSFLADMLTCGGTGGPNVSCGSSIAATANPCRTNWTCTRVFALAGVPGSTSLGIAALPAGTYTLTEATASTPGPVPCTQIQIINGLGQLMPPGTPIVFSIPATSAAALTFTFTNSCPLAGGASATGSLVTPVIGGSTFGLTNRANVEINPAPGSDDDARIDIRVRDANLIYVQGAHVTVYTDKGRLAMRQDFTGPGIVGYDVVEPASPSFGTIDSGDNCDQINATTVGSTQVAAFSGTVLNPYLGGYTAGSSQSIVDGYTDGNGQISACLYVNDTMVPGITPGRATITVIIENPNQYFQPFPGAANIIMTATVTVVGPPASVRVTASPTSLACGEKATITATITDAVGQNVSDHTRVELVSNFGSTIGGTGATLGFPGTGPVNPLSSSAAETFSGVATAFLLTSTEHVGPYEVVVTTGGSTGGSYVFDPILGLYRTADQTGGYSFPLAGAPTVIGGVGVFSTAPVSAQVTVTCSLPAAPAAAAPAVAAPRTGEGIRPPNTGDAGLASSSTSGLYFAIAATVAFALAGVATVKVARR